MPVRLTTRHICGHCDGFPVVAITTGTHHRDGSRITIRATCPDCQGTGRAPTRPTPNRTCWEVTA
ncbi:hypothetical protein GCM10009801_51230 [Streptomyces albiaxialis]|uniref:Molecular chaperone DnaJ n=1 Tax=Streptomyces albiaxialis TaxID=329523 RepID=A0ABN2WB73_9ACTN